MLKVVCIETTAGKKLQIKIIESLGTNLTSTFIWSSAYVLASYIVCHAKLFKGATILELGAGVGLPGIAAGFIGARKVILSDREEEQQGLAALRENIMMNLLEGTCSPMGLSWESFENSPDWPVLCTNLDFIIGADILYSNEGFYLVLRLIAGAIELNPNLVFLTTYQQRSAGRSLMPYLALFDLHAEPISLPAFMNNAHREGCCFMTDIYQDEQAASTDGNSKLEQLMTFDNIYLMKIKRVRL